MLNRKWFQLASILIVSVALVGGCKKKVEPEITPPEPVAAPTETPKAEPPRVEVEEPDFQGVDSREAEVDVNAIKAQVQGQLRTVYFEFDKYDLGDRARNELRANAEVLKQNGQVNVVIEGHCDERGTIEYNLALGERRAKSVREYLATLGIASSRMRIVSFGEERPEDFGHSESSWSRNRRAMFVVE